MTKHTPIQKLETGIEGFDYIASGGLPIYRTTLVSGTAGSGKTVLAAQFLAEGIRQYDQAGVFITFEESPEDIRKNMVSIGWDIDRWEQENKWVFVDGSPKTGQEALEVGDYDLGALLARIEYAVKKVGAKRVSLDSLGAIFTRFSRQHIIRQELFRITSALKAMNVTSILTAERTEEFGSIARYGIEEFVTDNVVILRNPLEQEQRRRTIEILKFRGTMHHKGEYSFTILPDQGIVVIPLAAIELKQKSSNIRITGGNDELDKMCGGGFFRDSVILVSGATGTGKTLMTTEFLAGGAKNGERTLLLAFEESREQLFRNAIGWSVDFEQLEKDGLLKVVCEYPESSGLEDHLLNIKRIVERYQPNRVAIDSLSALERVSSVRGFREFVIGLTSFIKHQEVAGLFTATTPSLMGGESVTQEHISTLTDSIILLRYVEMYGEMRRGITILKMRGSRHDKDIREFKIDGQGMHIGKPFRNVFGILSGNPMFVGTEGPDRLSTMFLDE